MDSSMGPSKKMQQFLWFGKSYSARSGRQMLLKMRVEIPRWKRMIRLASQAYALRYDDRVGLR